jgi:hypothetical protein
VRPLRRARVHPAVATTRTTTSPSFASTTSTSGAAPATGSGRCSPGRGGSAPSCTTVPTAARAGSSRRSRCRPPSVRRRHRVTVRSRPTAGRRGWATRPCGRCTGHELRAARHALLGRDRGLHRHPDDPFHVIGLRNIPSVWGAGKARCRRGGRFGRNGLCPCIVGEPVPRRHKTRMDRLSLRVWVSENACETRRTVGWRGKCSCGWRGRLRLQWREARADMRAHRAGDHESAGY